MGAMSPRLRLALIAHDGRKTDLLEWARWNRELLARHEIWATRHTGELVAADLGLKLHLLLPGPEGGDAQAAAMIARGELHLVAFLGDPLATQPHEPADRPLDDDLVAVSLDRRIGDDAQLRAVEADPGEAHRRGDVRALGEAEDAGSRGAAIDLARTRERRRLAGRKERTRGLAGRVRHALDTADRRSADRVEPGDRSGEDAHPRPAVAGGAAQRVDERRIGQRPDAQREQIDTRAEDGRPVRPERLVAGRLDDDLRPLREEPIDGADDRRAAGGPRPRRVTPERADEDDRARMPPARDPHDAPADGPEPDEADPPRRAA